MKVWRVTISGTYRNAKKDVFDYSGVEGTVPYIDEDLLKQVIVRRYAHMWVAAKKGEKESIHSVRETFIDKQVEDVAEMSFVGKNIMDMTREELQDMAAAYDLKAIPLFKTGVRQMQNIAYAQYATHVLKLQPKSDSKDDERAWRLLTNQREDGFNAAKNPPIIVGGETRRDTAEKVSNDEMIDHQASGKISTDFSIAELKAIAKAKNIPYSNNISREALYHKLYGESAAA